MAVWTHGTWTVKAGRDDEFVRAWRTMAARALSEFDPSDKPTLLRDLDRADVFVSFGPWRSLDDIRRFRESALFRDSAASMEDLLESFEPQTLDEVGLDG